MTTMRPLQLPPHPFHSPLQTTTRTTSILPPPRAADPSDQPNTAEPSSTDPSPQQPADPSFESRLAQVRLKYRSGTGKKAEQRRAKARKSKSGGSSGGVMLPPVSLREPTAAGGVKVELGFTPFSERLNGAAAGLGLAALVLVELGSGKGLLSFHNPPIVFLQVYTVAALAAVYIKFQKERISVWPKAAAPKTEGAVAAAGE